MHFINGPSLSQPIDLVECGVHIYLQNRLHTHTIYMRSILPCERLDACTRTFSKISSMFFIPSQQAIYHTKKAKENDGNHKSLDADIVHIIFLFVPMISR